MYGINGLDKVIADYATKELNEFLPSILEETRNTLRLTYGTIFDNIEKVSIHIEPAKAQNDGTTVSLNVKNHTVMYYSLHWYPACCAMVQINGFMYNVIPKALVHKMMDVTLDNIQKIYYDRLKRVVFNFVELPRRGELYEFGDVVPVKGTEMARMRYPYLYEWATSKRHQELLTVNHNTSNIIHFVDCMYTLEK